MLTQAEADALLAMSKVFVGSPGISLNPGTDASFDLESLDGKEQFLLDIWRGMIRISKIRFQNRHSKVVILARLCVDGAPHTNPDGVQMGRSHIHLYREGFEDKWAFSIDRSRFSNLSDPQQLLADFCGFCNIQTPAIQGGLL